MIAVVVGGEHHGAKSTIPLSDEIDYRWIALRGQVYLRRPLFDRFLPDGEAAFMARRDVSQVRICEVQRVAWTRDIEQGFDPAAVLRLLQEQLAKAQQRDAHRMLPGTVAHVEREDREGLVVYTRRWLVEA